MIACLYLAYSKLLQELSYHKQIARQLRTQYVEGIYDNPMTLKSRLTVTQGHWKQNHRVDHTRLTISRVIGRWILSWPWNVGQRSLKVIEISAIRNLGCGFLFAFYSNLAVSIAVCEIFSVRKWRDLENQDRGRSRSLKMAPFDRPYATFNRKSHMVYRTVGHCKYSSILYHFRVFWRWIISWLWNRG